MRISVVIAFTVGTVLSSLVALNAQACGESLFRVGKGVAYRAQTAPLPGNVLVVSPDTGLADRLAAAGHHIKVVTSPDKIAQELRTGKYDVVLASFNDREIVAKQMAGSAQAATYVPVTTESGQKAEAAQEYARYLSDDDDFTQFLRVIHRTLKASRAS
jgi:ABC-type amino acid transport substrate-binding protein